MNALGNKLRKTCAAVAVAASLGAAGTASADVIQLGFILDRSGSIGGGNWTTIVNGLSSAINTYIPVSGPDTYEISVVTFATGATINVNSVVVDSLAARSSLAAVIAALPYTGGNTYFADAFNAMNTALTDNVGTDGVSHNFVTASTAFASYVNFATDGVNNGPGDPVAARNSLITAGIDNISVEGIGSGVDTTFLQNSICYPAPCTIAPTYNFPAHGFYVGVTDANAYAAAVGEKIRVVTGQIPEPATLALMGVALAGIGFSRRREKP